MPPDSVIKVTMVVVLKGNTDFDKFPLPDDHLSTRVMT